MNYRYSLIAIMVGVTLENKCKIAANEPSVYDSFILLLQMSY